MFRVAAGLLKDFAARSPRLADDIGFTAVLHTHSRTLDYHPHLHLVVPGGSYDPRRRQWRKLRHRYLFNAGALARVWRARLLAALRDEAGLTVPSGLPEQWVVDCRRVGRGLPALQYLSRYLYRGVLPERNILREEAGQVTFRYRDSQSGQHQTVPCPPCSSCGSCCNTCCPGASTACAITASCGAMRNCCCGVFNCCRSP
jgi:hypothetical protein